MVFGVPFQIPGLTGWEYPQYTDDVPQKFSSNRNLGSTDGIFFSMPFPARTMPSTAGNDEASALVRDFRKRPGTSSGAYQAHTQLWAEVVPLDLTCSQFSSCAPGRGRRPRSASGGGLTLLDVRASPNWPPDRPAWPIDSGRDVPDGRKGCGASPRKGPGPWWRRHRVRRLGRDSSPIPIGRTRQSLDYLGRVGEAHNRG